MTTNRIVVIERMASQGLGVLLAFFLVGISGSLGDLNTGSFPDDFLFGVATASYQVEGAWAESDKGENIWDQLTHDYPELVLDHSTGDIASDEFHHLDEDIAILKDLGVDFYRFSFSWSRILPTGYANQVSKDGISYYNKLIDGLIANGITPMATIYHWDLPVRLQDLGGWANPQMANYFADYATILFENFGDRVQTWITFNEPYTFCPAYGVFAHAPATVHERGIGEYLCIYTVMLSHAKVYHLYDDNYRQSQKGQVGITVDITWFEPNTTSAKDVAASEKGLQFRGGIFLHPIYYGDFPDVVKEGMADRSAREGFPRSRLPEFTAEQIEYIKGTSDFLGLNHYTTVMAADVGPFDVGEPNFYLDNEVSTWADPSWEATTAGWLYTVPWGFTKLLVWLKNEYNNPPIYITENGYPDRGQLDDTDRVSYYQRYLSALLDAIDEGVNVKGYTAWSLMDNFEWLDGYVNRFGLYYVDMNDPSRPRTAKSSAKYYKQVLATKKVIVN